MAKAKLKLDPDSYTPDAWAEEGFQSGRILRPWIKPFIKWVGGKRGLLNQIEPLLPIRYGAYHEPFAGSAALFFAMQPERAYISDLNRHLVNTYQVVRNHPAALLRKLRSMEKRHAKDDKDYYYKTREVFNNEPDARPIARAARFIYLNKTCFNGLWRVNKKGHYNVPIGRYKNPKIHDPTLVECASSLLQRAQLQHATYEQATKLVQPGDFVYLDPPYVPLNATSNFTGYQAGGFGPRDQQDLRDIFALLDARGAQVMLSNSDTPEVVEMYRGFRVDRIWARRAINSKSSGRKAITEIVVRNFYLDRVGAQRVQERMQKRRNQVHLKVS